VEPDGSMLLTCSLWDLFAKEYLRVRCWRLLQLYPVCGELCYTN
jgi:hypothetical protein